jgi:hypothetical protein
MKVTLAYCITIQRERMAYRYSVAVIVVPAVLSGCATLTDSIEQRIAVSEQCRLATSLPPARLDASGALASIQLGNIGVCSINKEHLLPMCALDQIGAKFLPASHPSGNAMESGHASTQEKKRAEPETSRDKTAAANMAVFVGALEALRQSMHDLARETWTIDPYFQQVASTMRTGDLSARAAALANIERKAEVLQKKLAKVRHDKKELRLRISGIAAELDALTRVELLAWDANLDVHLKRIQQAISGDYMLIIQEGIKDQVLTHVARRTLDMLHASLKAPDAVLQKLDDKAYGAVSIGYLAFGPNLQGAVKNAYENIVRANKLRQDQAAKSDAKEAAALDLTNSLAMELRRAACDNLLQGTQFSMLTELLDTSIIMYVEKKHPVKIEVEKAPPVAFWPSGTQTLASSPSAQSGIFLRTSLPAAIAAMPFQEAEPLASGAVVDTAPPPYPPISPTPPEVTPAGVHMTHTWTARQQLLVEAISAKVNAAPLDGTAATLAFQHIDAVDESAVQRLADAATATTVDDAVRLSPGLLGSGATGASPQLKNAVNVITAASAVSSAAVTLKVNLSVSNVNTFNPTNYNNIAPVINLPVPPLPAPVLCVAGGLASADTLCTRDGDGFVISFTGRGFRDDSCAPGDLEPALTAVGLAVADYRARYGVEYTAKIEGYASLPNTRLANCPQLARAPAKACHYVNHLRTDITVVDCDRWRGDMNLALSAARAGNAARVLESAGQGAVTVNRLVANGTRTAARRGGPPSSDRTVIIRLQPRIGQ